MAERTIEDILRDRSQGAAPSLLDVNAKTILDLSQDCLQLVAEVRHLRAEHVSKESLLMFLGYITAGMPELQHIEPHRLLELWRDFRAQLGAPRRSREG